MCYCITVLKSEKMMKYNFFLNLISIFFHCISIALQIYSACEIHSSVVWVLGFKGFKCISQGLASSCLRVAVLTKLFVVKSLLFQAVSQL